MVFSPSDPVFKMFPNQISTRELLSGSQSMQDYSRDFSQLQNAQFTQFDMSQSGSQDFYSQPDQYSAGSTQDLQSQERKVSSYEKYMAKPLFDKNKGRTTAQNLGAPQKQTHSRPVAHQKPSQQQMNAFKNRAKEKEERDMLSSIVCIVKECSYEVKQNIYSLKEADQDAGVMLKKSVEKLSNTVEESSNKILKAIHSREELVTEHLKLQQDIRMKDEKIQDLLKQSSEFCTNEATKSMQGAMKAFFEDQQSATENKLQKITDLARDQIKMIKDIGSCQKSGHEDSKNQQHAMKYTGERQMQEIEKRLQLELGLLRDDFDRQRRDLEDFCKNQLQAAHQKVARDIELQISRGLENSVGNVSGFTKDFCREQQSDIRDLLRQQQREMEASFVYQASKQSEKLLKQTQEQNSRGCKELQRELTGKLDIIHAKQKQLKDDNDKQFKELKETFESNENDRPWLNDNVPKQVQEQLNELHSNHMSEIKRLEKEIEQERREREQREAKLREESNRIVSVCDTGPLENVYDFTDYDSSKRRSVSSKGRSGESMFGKDATFLSPRPPNGKTWSSKSIFGRANPSPVAAVLPQQISSSKSHSTSSKIDHSVVQLPDQDEEARQLRSGSKQIVGQTNEKDKFTFHSQDDIGNTQNTSSKVGASMKKTKGTGKKYKGKKAKMATYENFSSLDQTGDNLTVPSKQKGIQQVVEQHTRNKVGLVKPISSARSGVQQLTTSLYDFHDEMSPVMATYQDKSGSHQMQTWNRSHSTADNKILMSPESGSSELGSSSSSPSVSVTEMFIRRRIRHDIRTPTINDSQRDVALPDLFGTPNLSELFTEGNMQRMENIHAKQTFRRLAERRKLCDFDTEVIQTIQCSNKRSRLYKPQ